jgi:hypothetical protein
MSELNTTEERYDVAELRDACLHSYAVFAELMQDDGWFDDVHRMICMWAQKHVMKFEADFEKNPDKIMDVKLQLTLPRGALKSTIVTKYFPVWITLRQYYLFNNQGVRSLIVTNTFTNAKKKLRDIRGLFDSNDLFKRMFPEVLPKSGRSGWTDEGANINRNCSFPEYTFECAGVGTKLTGRHYNVILEDDTTAPDESEMKVELTTPSRATVEQAIGFHKASTPLYVPKGLRVSVVVTTRWADEDIVDYVRDHEHYHYFDMPALDAEGNPNFSMFYSLEALEEIKLRVGPYMFSCLYLNAPLDASLRVFNSETFIWKPADEIPTEGRVSIAIDPAASEKDEACETSITVCQHIEKEVRKSDGSTFKEQYQIWWEDINGHMSFEEQVTTTIDKAVYYEEHVCPVAGIIVETVAYQAALEYMLMQEMERRGVKFDLIPFASRKAKEVRIEGMQPMFFRGRIWWVKGGISDQVPSQLKQFPNGKLVDTIDSFSMHKALYGWDKGGKVPKRKDKSDADTYMAIVEANRKKAKKKRTGMVSGLASFESGSHNTMSSGLGRKSDSHNLIRN